MLVHEYRHKCEHVSLMLITGTVMQYEVLCLFYTISGYEHELPQFPIQMVSTSSQPSYQMHFSNALLFHSKEDGCFSLIDGKSMWGLDWANTSMCCYMVRLLVENTHQFLFLFLIIHGSMSLDYVLNIYIYIYIM